MRRQPERKCRDPSTLDAFAADVPEKAAIGGISDAAFDDAARGKPGAADALARARAVDAVGGALAGG